MFDPDEDELSGESADRSAPQALPFAPAWKRFLAFIIDYLILQTIMVFVMIGFYGTELSSVQQVLSAPLSGSNLGQDYLTALQGFMTRHWEISIGLYGLYFFYFLIFWKYGGQTIGARIFRIGVVSLHHRNLSWMEGILRSITMLCGMMLYYIPFLFVINPVYHQRLHDSVSGSVVISYPKAERKPQ